MLTRLLIALATAVAAVAAASAVAADPPGSLEQDQAGIIDLPAGYSYSVLTTACMDTVESTESGMSFPMPEDLDGNVVFPAGDGNLWLLSNHELTQVRPGDFAGDANKCAVGEQATTDDGDSDAWGSVSRLTLAADGTTVLDRELITTGLHNLCAANPTPWGTYITNEEFPYGRRLSSNDPDKRSGWAWEIDPTTGSATKLTAMGWFSHEQEDYLRNGEWWLTDDQGDFRFIYKFVPTAADDLTEGKLYGLKFDRGTSEGTWVGPLDPLDPHADMVGRGIDPTAWGFGKAEGLVANLSRAWIVFSESGATTSDPGRVWRLSAKGTTVKGKVLAEGDWVNFSRPDNLRFAPNGDLYIMEDHGSSDRAAHPEINANEDIWVLPEGERGTKNLRRFANTPDEPTGPWFHANGGLLYLSLQGNPSRVLAIRGDFN